MDIYQYKEEKISESVQKVFSYFVIEFKLMATHKLKVK